MAFQMIATGRSSAGWYVQFNGMNKEGLKNVLGSIVEDFMPDGAKILRLDTANLTDLQARNWFIIFSQAAMQVPDEITRRIQGNPPTKAIRSVRHYSAQPTFKRKEHCEQYAVLRDQHYNLAERHGAMAGGPNQAEDCAVLEAMGMRGGDNEAEPDYQAMHA